MSSGIIERTRPSAHRSIGHFPSFGPSVYLSNNVLWNYTEFDKGNEIAISGLIQRKNLTEAEHCFF